MTEKRIVPFSNGTQFLDWTASNCERCTKGADNTVGPNGWPGCPIEAALTEAAFDDGAVTADIAERMGYSDDDMRYVWPCREVQWTPEWIAEVTAKRQAETEANDE